MCAVSMVADHWKDRLTGPQWDPHIQVGSFSTGSVLVDASKLDELKKEIEHMKEMLKKAKLYDEVNNEPDCEMEGKVALIRKIAEAIGVNLDDVFGPKEG